MTSDFLHPGCTRPSLTRPLLTTDGKASSDRAYERGEVIADAVVHALGTILGVAGAGALVAIGSHRSAIWLVAIAIYLTGLLTMLGLSAAYNMWPVSPIKWWLRRLDHSAIYLLIATTYTAFLLPVHSAGRTALLAVIWFGALAGIMLKLVWPRQFDRTSVALYLAMGWSGLFAMGPIMTDFAPTALALIVVGGVLYSLGVIFHTWQTLRFQNAIWHGFVLAAALCHYAAIAMLAIQS